MALLGPVIWAAHFLTIYALESVLCRITAGHWHALVITAATILAAVATVVHGSRQQPRLGSKGVDGFLARTALTLDGLSLLAVLMVSVTGLALPACR